jgi:hypothetical protein
VAADRRPQKQHKIKHYELNIIQQIHYKYATRDMTENVLSCIFTYASKQGENQKMNIGTSMYQN